ncbi:hypothetical protein U4E84_05465 [Halorubrum sp. AD140]|uniref:hypothetical protein n=1 Tax=Halorubrum sp. AD140 TaxID=3050073 RepID=UPI002ACCB4E4|nr:hypothetical protein [Halorubrum sp. AD140]MDZ5810793.1 hypothetical protein [Halorubrum sp. AD140]
MNKRAAVSVFLATLLYQFIDAGAELLLPFYDRGGIITALLFWLIPAGTAFILVFRATKEHPLDSRQRKLMYRSTVLGAGIGQFISILILLPTGALPYDLVGGLIIAGFTAGYVFFATYGGLNIVRPEFNEKMVSYPFAVIAAGLLFVIAVGETYESEPYYIMAVGEALAGVWFLIVARKLKQNKEGNNEKVSSTT